MRRALKWGMRGIAVLVLLVVLLVLHTVWFKPLRIGWFYERVFIEFALKDPQLLSSLRMLPPWLDFHSDKLTDRSLARGEALNAKLDADLATLRRYDRSRLEGDALLSYEILEQFLAVQVEGRPYQYHDYPLNQLFGVQNGLPTYLATQHPVERPRDAENYLKRLAAVPAALDQVMEGVHLREARGIIPPRFVVEKVLEEMRGFVAAPATGNILYTSFVERLDGLREGVLAQAERERLLAEAARLVETGVYPAYQGLIDYYEGLLPRARPNNGVWDLPEGPAYYAWAVRYHTTTDMTPAEVHALGLSEVARIEAGMDAILRGEGLEEGSVGARVQEIARRPDQRYPDTDAGRLQIIEDYQAMSDAAMAIAPDWFGVLPQAGMRVERVPEFRERTAPGAYYNAPAFDGSRPGVFYINLRNIEEIARFSMRTLAYHEGVPGHHFQIALKQELRGVPTFRKLLPFTAYSEGWALYAERLSSEMGLFPTPLDELGRLQAEMFRAVRLVVDTGLHSERWTREQAIDYMLEKTGMPETDVVAEIERYLVMPGQALAYKVGMEHIVALRARAEAELGERFDIRGFHDAVLTGGAMPLVLLTRRVEAWIDEVKAGA